MVPALYAAASAVTGAGERPTVSAAAGADDTTTSVPGTEVEVEHGVTTVKSDDDATASTTPTTPSPTTPTLPDDSTPAPTTPTVPDDSTPVPAPPVTQEFSSTGGSIEVTLANGALSLGNVSPAAGFTSQVHDDDADRVEVRFFDAHGQEWRIRIEVAGGALSQEITFHG